MARENGFHYKGCRITNFVESCDPHCSGCGAENPSFLEVSFQEEYEESSTQMEIRTCTPLGHEERALAMLKEVKDQKFLDQFHCFVCGKLIIRNGRHVR